MVVHYEVPDESEKFVHRSGRTGRAGKSGHNIVLFTRGQEHYLSNLEREMKFSFKFCAPPSPKTLVDIAKEQMDTIANRITNGVVAKDYITAADT